MKLLLDFFPLVLFFIGYKLFNIYIATAIAMVASGLQVIYYRFKHQRYEKMHIINLSVIVIFGGATLFFHNPWFIKWKPTGLYWITALAFFLSPIVSKKPLIQRMMESNVRLPNNVWLRLNTAWALFFIGMGVVNLYVAYHFSTDFWVNFKLFGGTLITLFFVCVQALYLTRHVLEKDLT